MVSSYIYDTVKFVKEKYNGLGIHEICEEEDILVYDYPLVGKVDGFLHYDEDCNMFEICLKESLSDEEKITTLAHELGHYFLHKDECTTYLSRSSIHFDSGYEKDADIFASDFLLNDDVFDNCYYYTSYQIASMTNVPEKFIKLKYEKLYKKSY